MSVFSKLKLSKKAAKEHKAKQVEKDKEAVVVPYKHVPTHAAVDALSGAPSSWKAEDRPLIKNHHMRRSQMALSRTGSMLSTVSYTNSVGGPSGAAVMNRNSSYNSLNPTWFDRTGDPRLTIEPPTKRYHPSRGHSYHDSGIGPSPLGSKVQSEDVSPVESSGNSTNSNSSSNLEMHSSRKRQSYRPQGQQPIVYAEKDIFDRLHTNTKRKLGEAPISTTGPVEIKKPVAAPVAALVAQDQKEKKQRWSLRGMRRASTVAA